MGIACMAMILTIPLPQGSGLGWITVQDERILLTVSSVPAEKQRGNTKTGWF
jgi:hypothetical protein